MWIVTTSEKKKIIIDTYIVLRMVYLKQFIAMCTAAVEPIVGNFKQVNEYQLLLYLHPFGVIGNNYLLLIMQFINILLVYHEKNVTYNADVVTANLKLLPTNNEKFITVNRCN